MVSQGAVLRAVNKKNGPQRLIDANFGIFREEEFNESNQSRVSYDFIKHNYANGLGYLDTIDWLIKKVSARLVLELSASHCPLEPESSPCSSEEAPELPNLSGERPMEGSRESVCFGREGKRPYSIRRGMQ